MAAAEWDVVSQVSEAEYVPDEWTVASEEPAITPEATAIGARMREATAAGNRAQASHLAPPVEEPSAPWGDVLRSIPGEVRRSAAQLVAGSELSRMEAEPTGLQREAIRLGLAQPTDPQEIADEQAILAAIQEDAAAEAVPNMSALQRGVQQVAPSLLVTAPALAVAAATRNPLIAAGALYPATQGSAYGGMRAQGIPEEIARPHSQLQGGIESATELIPLTQLLKVLPAGQILLRSLVAELPTESLATLGQGASDFVARAQAAGQEVTPELVGQGLLEASKSLPETWVTTILTTGLQAGGAALLNRGVEREQEATARREANRPIAPGPDPAGFVYPTDDAVGFEVAKEEPDVAPEPAAPPADAVGPPVDVAAPEPSPAAEGFTGSEADGYEVLDEEIDEDPTVELPPLEEGAPAYDFETRFPIPTEDARRELGDDPFPADDDAEGQRAYHGQVIEETLGHLTRANDIRRQAEGKKIKAEAREKLLAAAEGEDETARGMLEEYRARFGDDAADALEDHVMRILEPEPTESEPAKPQAPPADAVPTLPKALPKDRAGIDRAILDRELHDLPEELTQAVRERFATDERVRQNVRELVKQAGWDTVGGKRLMDRDWAPKPGDPDSGGRTKWLPRADWWIGRPGDFNEKQTKQIVEKALAGKKLGKQQQRYVDYLAEIAVRQEALARKTPDITPADLTDVGLPPNIDNAADLELASRAAELDPDAFERIVIQFEDDDAGFRNAVKELVASHEQGDETGAGRAQDRGPEDRGEEEVGAEDTGYVIPEDEVLADLTEDPDGEAPVASGRDYELTATVNDATIEYRLRRGRQEDPSATFTNYAEALAAFQKAEAELGDIALDEAPEGEQRDHEANYRDEPAFPKVKTAHADKFSGETIPQAEADARIASWKAHAKRIGKEEDHSDEVIVSLFDASGVWSQPYIDAGYTVMRMDRSRGDDIMKINPVVLAEDVAKSGKRVVGVLCAPPCTSFSASGARWWGQQHDSVSREWVLKKYGKFAAEYFDRPLDYAVTLASMVGPIVETTNPEFYALENPVGRIAKEVGLPQPALSFNPNHFGDPYTKRTFLWGEINVDDMPTAHVEATEGSRVHKLRGDRPEEKIERSITPEGFSYAFFVANNTSALELEAEPDAPADGLSAQLAELEKQWDALDAKARGMKVGDAKSAIVDKQNELSERMDELIAEIEKAGGTVEDDSVEAAFDLFGNDADQLRELNKRNKRLERKRGAGRGPVPADAAPRGDMFREQSERERAEARRGQTDLVGRHNSLHIVRAAYPSGMTRPADFDVAIKAEAPVGLDLREMSKPLTAKVIEALNAGTPVFLDSGAFGAFRKGEQIDPALTLGRYTALAEAINDDAVDNLTVVAPDVVGDPKATLDMLRKHAKQIANLGSDGVNIIVPVQTSSDMSAADFAREAAAILTEADSAMPTFWWGIPSNAAAMSDAQFREFLEELAPDKLHILGAATREKALPRLQAIDAVLPDQEVIITLDANVLRALARGPMAPGERAEELERTLREHGKRRRNVRAGNYDDDVQASRAPPPAPRSMAETIERERQRVLDNPGPSSADAEVKKFLDLPGQREDAKRISEEQRARLERGESDVLKASGVQAIKWAPGTAYVPMYQSAGMPGPSAPSFFLATVNADVTVPDKIVRREAAMRTIERAFNMKVFQGKPFKVRGALGFFRPRNFETRIKAHNDLEVTAHEFFHWLDRTYPTIRALYHERRFSTELKSVSYDTTKIFEGFAEFGRLFLTKETDVRVRTPNFYKAFVAEAKRVGILDKLVTAQKTMHAWYLQGAEKRALSKIGPEKKSFAEWWDEQTKGRVDKEIQVALDWLHSIKVVERTVAGRIQDATISPYKAARLMAGARGVVREVFDHGTVAFNGAGDIVFTGTSLAHVFAEVADVMEETMSYYVGRRAYELRAQGREHLLEKDEIDALINRGRNSPKATQIEESFERYQAFLERMMEFYIQGGLVSKEKADLMRDLNKNYVPFNRILEALESKEPGGKPRGRFMRLKGGTQNLRDTFENITGSVNALVAATLKNHAKQMLYRSIEKSPKGQRFAVKVATEQHATLVQPGRIMRQIARELSITSPQAGQALKQVIDVVENDPDLVQAIMYWSGKYEPSAPDIDVVYVNGEPRYYQIGDPLLMETLQLWNSPRPTNIALRLLGGFSGALRRGVTMMPDFLIPNLIRDTANAYAISKSGQTPFLDSVKGMVKFIADSEEAHLFFANGGGFSSLLEGDAAATMRRKLERLYVNNKIDYRTVLDTPAKMLDFYDKYASSFEYGTRIGEFSKALKQGQTMREAAFRGREVSTDFAMQGTSQLLLYITTGVAFMKARMQGLYQLERQFMEKGGKQTLFRGDDAVRFAFKAFMLLTLPSIALWWANHDDPRYKRLPDWIKRTHWVILVGERAFLIPKPFEQGAMFATVPEQTLEYIKNRDGAKYAEAMAFLMTEAFNLNPIPTAVKGPLDLARNKDFAGRPIIPESLEDVAPEEQFTAYTSDTAIAVGQAFGVSPAKLDYLARSYLGTAGLWGLSTADALHDPAIGTGEKPTGRGSEWYVVRRFVRESPVHGTAQEEEFYKVLEASREVAATFKKIEKDQRMTAAMAYLKSTDRRVYFALAGTVDDIAKEASTINATMRLVRYDPNKSGEQKRRELDELQRQKNLLFDMASQQLSRAKIQDLAESEEWEVTEETD